MYFFSALLVLAGLPVLAQETPETQEKPVDTVAKRVDTLRYKFLPTGIRIGTDLISIIKSQVTDRFTGWEANADVDFYRYYLALDYGSWSRRDSVTTNEASSGKGYYENHGNYFRAGVDINFLLKDPDRNMFFIGFRYGHSNFDEKLSVQYVDQFYGTVNQSFSSSGIRGHWGEITTGLRVKIFPGFWMGYSARLKFSPSVRGGDSRLQAFDIPGYGVAAKTTYWGFNYQVFWRIPFRKFK